MKTLSVVLTACFVFVLLSCSKGKETLDKTATGPEDLRGTEAAGATGAKLSGSGLALGIAKVSLKPGEREVILPVELRNTEGPIKAVQIVLSYDTHLVRLREIKRTDRTRDISVFLSNTEVPGKIRLAIIDLGTNEIPSGTGPIAQMVFDLSSGLSSGTKTELIFSVDGDRETAVFDGDGNYYPIRVENGVLTISS